MSDGLLAKQAHMNTGAIPTSAEDLAQKHQALLHEYSRLKAKYTVLKKAVIKEQSTNNTLQGNVKEKEKELRKLQEQLDLLAFHNERLTKRIEAVQDHEQKGSHFSLLGGAMKKELEKSTQALDAANLDLSKKIEENERLHEELSENHHIYTNHVNELHIQIAKLEKQVEELQVEISTIQKDRRDQLAALKQEKAALQSELDKLKQDLADKSRILTENETSLKQNDIDLRSELESLRAILLSKAGDIENQDNKANIPKLADVVPVSDALNALEQQARDYIYALREQTSLKGLPHEIAAKLKISTETFSEQVEIIAKKLEESKEQIKALSLDKERSELASAEQLQKITGLEKTIDELRLELSKKRNAEELEQLEKENKRLKQEIEQLNEKIQETRRELEEAKTATKQTLDKETQADLAVETSEEKFVYPTTEKVEEEQKKEEQEEVEEEDDEVFVYNGQDAPAEAKAPETNETLENAFKEKEQQMQAYYESQIRQLTEKLQMADGKAARFARLVDTLKERITAETDENARLVAENERLHKECAKVQEILTTTETNYQNQVDMMTEYITQLQQQQQQMQGQR